MEVIEFGYYGIALWSRQRLPTSRPAPEVAPLITIPTLDVSEQTQRHVIVAAGTEETYQGQVDTLLMPDRIKLMHHAVGEPCLRFSCGE